MNLRQVVASGTLAALLAAFSCAPAFAAQAADAAPDATAPAAPAAPAAGATKKQIRAANHAFTMKVRKQLQHTKGLDQANIAAFGNAKTGQVSLSGQVASEDQIAVAVAAVKQVPGVTSVSNKLSLREEH